jgi:serine/threonine protein kinase
MVQRDARLLGGIYRIGQVMGNTSSLMTCTGYNRNTNDMVGLFVLDVPPVLHLYTVRQLLQPLEQRRAVQSPHVLAIHDWGVDGSRAYIVTAPPRGVTLRHILDTENIDFARALDFARQLARGLKALHEHEVVGLDLRPQLITVETTGIVDYVQIDDIGLRRLLRAFDTVHEQRNDTIDALDPRYAPPEYIQNAPVGTWSDIYQVGLLFFELVTGRLPYIGRTNAETGVLQNTHPIPSMQQYKHDVPAALQTIIDGTLVKDPYARFPSATALLDALDTIELDIPSPSSPLLLAQPGQVGMTTEMTSFEERPGPGHTLRPSTLLPSESRQGVSSETGVYAYLVFKQNTGEVRRIPLLAKEVIIGRLDPKRGVTPDVDLSDFDPRMTVSRQHARIRFSDNFFYLEDLKSRNKTRLGELVLIPLQSELIQHGDELRFGSVSMTFTIPGMIEQPTIRKPKEE